MGLESGGPEVSEDTRQALKVAGDCMIASASVLLIVLCAFGVVLMARG